MIWVSIWAFVSEPLGIFFASFFNIPFCIVF
jgi:hypothetical protein